MQPLYYKNALIAGILTFTSAIIILSVSAIMGKDAFFLWLNTDLGKNVDAFFAFWTHLGEEITWVIVGILFIIYRRQQLPLYFSALIFSTLFAQLIKNTIMHNEPRPVKAIADISLIHTVDGVKILLINSFPSGHTTEAFTVFLLACLVIKKPWIIIAGFIYALLVAYSRIYLAQHFPRDTGAGMIVAIVSIALALWVQLLFNNRKGIKA